MPTIKISNTIKVSNKILGSAIALQETFSTKKKKKQQRKPIYLRIQDKYKIKYIYSELDSSPFVKVINIIKVKEVYKIIKLEDRLLLFKQVSYGKLFIFKELTAKDKDDFLSDFKSFLEEYLDEEKIIIFNGHSAPPRISIPSPILTDEELEELLQSFKD